MAGGMVSESNRLCCKMLSQAQNRVMYSSSEKKNLVSSPHPQSKTTQPLVSVQKRCSTSIFIRQTQVANSLVPRAQGAWRLMPVSLG